MMKPKRRLAIFVMCGILAAGALLYIFVWHYYLYAPIHHLAWKPEEVQQLGSAFNITIPAKRQALNAYYCDWSSKGYGYPTGVLYVRLALDKEESDKLMASSWLAKANVKGDYYMGSLYRNGGNWPHWYAADETEGRVLIYDDERSPHERMCCKTRRENGLTVFYFHVTIPQSNPIRGFMLPYKYYPLVQWFPMPMEGLGESCERSEP
jgi:hypothetical protein